MTAAPNDAPPNDATARQIQAAQPDASTWLSANAGSGKTRVLTDRVARLLLRGVLPQNILCLTYTKAAASEMQNRLFARLGAWTMMENAQLRGELAQLGVHDGLDGDQLQQARTLFARAIETPGGLKIQTIHAFCGSILRRFPLEAGISPYFVEIDEQEQTRVLAEVADTLATDHPALFAQFAWHLGHDAIPQFLAVLLDHGRAFAAAPDTAGLWAALGLPEGVTEADLVAQVLTPEALALLRRLSQDLAADSEEAKNAEKIAKIDLNTASIATLMAVENLLLVQKPTTGQDPYSKLASFPKKATRAALPYMDQLEALAQRVMDMRQTRLELAVAERTQCLTQIAALFFAEYERCKQTAGYLDFADLIEKTRALLLDTAVAQWVLYRLDGGIDHILVDEAQDTSPSQWDVIELLTQEFTSGEGAKADVERTIFVVGDKKQSIYSFQGADPGGFDRMSDQFTQRLGAIDKRLEKVALEYSFRSAPAVLQTVDMVFAGGGGLGDTSLHRAFKHTMPGRVDVWPVVPKPDTIEEGPWTDPMDRVMPDHQDATLARSLAQQIGEMLAHQSLPTVVGGGGYGLRRIQPRDILILVRGRKARLFGALHRAFKAEGLPVAGSDRITLKTELAVQDLLSLMRFLALPEDSLSLAQALRSPLFGWSEQQLYSVAYNRPTPYLWRALQGRRGQFPDTVAALEDLLQKSDYARPYEVLEYILNTDGRLKRLIGRLGVEAVEGVDTLLSQALLYEQAHIPSLSGFLIWMDANALDIKRQVDSASNLIRVMSVHGAKGLEAPIVILPDAMGRKAPRPPQVLEDSGRPVWIAQKDTLPNRLLPAYAAAQKQVTDEWDRLLYVAMTRAENWLIVMGAEKDRIPYDGCWHDRIDRALNGLGAMGGGENAPKRFEAPSWPKADVAVHGGDDPKETTPDLRRFVGAVSAPKVTPVLTPSDLPGAKVLPGTATDDPTFDSAAYGTAVHRLLQILPLHPQTTWAQIAQDTVPTAYGPQALREAAAVIQDASLEFMFDKETLSEVPFVAHIGTPVRGVLDRVVIRGDEVLIIDFKTNRVTPTRADDVPEGLLRQMACYATAGAQIFQGKTINVAILWTKPRVLMDIPKRVLDRV